ncbi:MAG TPA: ABC transporter substrate-binding protein [Candidatus Bathyarchaeia archaeon]|nr:ABC transporter substrate-binding protein [Candidatus Bathyarchaeia archaeon]
MSKRKAITKLQSALIAVVLIAIIVGAYFYYASQLVPVQKPVTLVIAMDTSSIVSLDPAKAYEFESIVINNNVYNTLVGFKGVDYSTVYPELADSWTVASDGVTWTFNLKHGLTFPSGTPINAAAVIYSFQRVVQLQQPPSWVITQFGINNHTMTALDDYTVQFKLNAPYAKGLFLSCIAFPVASIVDPTVVKAHETNGDMGAGWLLDHSAGSGAFTLGKWQRGTEIVLNANKNYWRGKPGVDVIDIKEIKETLDQRMLLERGDIDIAWNLLPDQLAALKDNKDLSIVSAPAFQVFYLGMNAGSKPFNDPRVRNAVRWAIDYNGIINNILKGAAIGLQTIIPKGIAGYDPQAPFAQNITKAKSLLADAGYPNGFSVQLATPSSISGAPTADIAAKIKSDLAKVGIDVQIQLITYAQLLTQYRAQSLQMVIGRWGSDYADPNSNAAAFALCRTTGPSDISKQLAWRNKYANNVTSNLVVGASRELNDTQRLADYKQLTGIILNDGPFAMLYQLVIQRAVRNSVKGFTVSPLTLEDFSTITKQT